VVCGGSEFECDGYAEGDEGAKEREEAGDVGSTGERAGSGISRSVATADTIRTKCALDFEFLPDFF
jgi:hypothetical protein